MARSTFGYYASPLLPDQDVGLVLRGRVLHLRAIFVLLFGIRCADASESPSLNERVLLAKAAVLGAYLYVLFLIALPVDVVQLGGAQHGNLLIVVMYYLGAKAISIVSYLSLCMVAVWLAKRFRNRVLSVAAMALTLGVVTIVLGVLLFALVSSPGWQWSIGVE